MDRVNRKYSERAFASVMNAVGFASCNISTLVRFGHTPVSMMKNLAKELAEVAKYKDASTVSLEDFYHVLEQRGENIDHLLHFLKTNSKSRQSVSVAYPVVKEYTNPLKIPDKNSADLITQPSYIADHLPLMREALEYKNNQKRTNADGYKHITDEQNSGFGVNGKNGMANGERGDEQSGRMKYPAEAGRSRHRMQALSMSDCGDIYGQRASRKRGPSSSPPPPTHINTILSALQSKATPFLADVSSSYQKPSLPGSRGHGHQKNGVVNARPDHRHDRFAMNTASPLAAVSGGGDSRDMNGAYSPPRDDLPEVDEEEDVHPTKVWPPKEDPLPSNHAIEPSFKKKLNDAKSRNSEWSNSPRLSTTNSIAASSLTNTPLSIHSSSKHREPLASRFNKASAKDLTALFSHKSDPIDSPPPPSVSSKSSKSTKKASSSRSKSKGSSRSKSKPSSNPLTFNSPKPNNSSKVHERKRPFEDLLETSTTTEEMVETPEKMDSPLHLQSSVDQFKSSSRHKSSKSKVTVEETTHIQTGSKSKRRKMESSVTPESTPRSKSKHSPEPLCERNCSPKPTSESLTDVHLEKREKRSQGQSSDNTPSRTSALLHSSDEDEANSTRKVRKVSRSPPPSNKRRLSEWEDVPLSKRVPAASIQKLESRPLDQSMTPPSVENSGDNNRMVKLGPNLTMKFNLVKIMQDSASGTGSPASTAPPPAALESNPASVFGEKMEEEEVDWVLDHAARRRHRSRSLSDGGDDAAVMRFIGPPGPSPPSLPDADSLMEPTINAGSAELEGDARRTSTDSLPPPSLMPTVPLPKIKLQKVKGTTSSFVTAPADPEAVPAPPASNKEHRHRRPARPHHRSKRRTNNRSHSSRSPSPPTLAPALTPPPASADDDQAPTLTMVAGADAVESVVLEQSEDESFVQKKYHSQALSPPAEFVSSSKTTVVEPAKAAPPSKVKVKVKVKSSMSSSKKSGGSSSKKKFSKRSSSKSRSRPKLRPQLYKRSRARTPPSPERSLTPPTPPAVFEPACEDLGFGFHSPMPSPSPSPPPPPPPPPAPSSSRSKSKAPRSSTAGLGGGSSSSSSKKGIGASNTASVDSGTSSNKSKKAATSSSKSKSHSGGSKSTPASSAGGGSSSTSVKVTSSADTPAETTKMEVQVDVMLHGSSYYFDSNGVQIWICPLCHMEDNGSLMIGCDQCDDWYHGRCLNIYTEPEQDIWYCPRCVKKQATAKEAMKPKKKGSKAGRRRA